LIEIVGAVVAVQSVFEATSRIPSGLRGLTFYGVDDEWLFLESGHKNMCDDCGSFNLQIFSGRELRRRFPYHRILDANTIAAMVHLHCGCLLVRASF
jgi:hypothetical protein